MKTWWQQKDTSSVVKNKYPFNDIYISLTDDCNLRCIYCFNYEKRKTRQCGGKEVNVRQLKEVMSQFKELGGTGVVFTGGEPTLNKSLIPLAKYAVELGLSPKLITNGKISDTKLDEICEIFGLTDFIKSLPDSYNSIITEGENDFSEGQKQRISIIRALLSEPDILILDESTSSLDAFTESSIMEYIKSLTELTVIIIAHRLSTIIGCDKIYVLENGTVVEAGNHNELIDKHGVYSEMLYQQKIINERNTI